MSIPPAPSASAATGPGLTRWPKRALPAASTGKGLQAVSPVRTQPSCLVQRMGDPLRAEKAKTSPNPPGDTRDSNAVLENTAPQTWVMILRVYLTPIKRTTPTQPPENTPCPSRRRTVKAPKCPRFYLARRACRPPGPREHPCSGGPVWERPQTTRAQRRRSRRRPATPLRGNRRKPRNSPGWMCWRCLVSGPTPSTRPVTPSLRPVSGRAGVRGSPTAAPSLLAAQPDVPLLQDQNLWKGHRNPPSTGHQSLVYAQAVPSMPAALQVSMTRLIHLFLRFSLGGTWGWWGHFINLRFIKSVFMT